jgi:hypothetical protein
LASTRRPRCGSFLDSNVGIEVKPNTFYTLETHLNLLEPRTLRDASGFEICSTSQEPAYKVSISRLGRDPQLGTSSSSTCTPNSKNPIYLLSAQAQMNTRGVHASLTVNRAGGRPELIYDRPFDFSNSETVALPLTSLLPGDTLTTRCDYARVSSGGPGVDDELCAMYVLHWPAHTLVSADSAGRADRCTQ